MSQPRQQKGGGAPPLVGWSISFPNGLIFNRKTYFFFYFSLAFASHAIKSTTYFDLDGPFIVTEIFYKLEHNQTILNW